MTLIPLILASLLLFAATQGNQIDPPNLYVLTFQYAAKNNTVPQENKLTIIFNKEIIASINPTDSKVTTVNFNVLVEKGMNFLIIQGHGNQTNKGISIDNVQLIKKGSTVNVIENGDFQLPKLTGLQTPQSIPGWYSDSLMKINSGSTYNIGWNSRVCWFGSDKVQKNFIITQNITFDNQYNHIPPLLPPLRLKLEIDWARRQFKNASTSQATILFNNQIIDTLIATEEAKGINYAVYWVDVNMGVNELTLDGNSFSDGFGISVGYVCLSRKDKIENLLQNFDFTDPYVAVNQTKLMKGGISFWSGSNLEIGDCKVFNSKWRGGYCIQLDSDKNQRYTQIINVDWYLYKKLRDGLPIK